MSPLDARLRELVDAVHRRTLRLGPEAQWRIGLSLDIAVGRLAPRPLPIETWRTLALSSIESLTKIGRRGLAGERLAAITMTLLQGAAWMTRGDRRAAAACFDRADLELGDLGPLDLLGDPWDRALGVKAFRNGEADRLGLTPAPSRR